jgi:putative protease
MRVIATVGQEEQLEWLSGDEIQEIILHHETFSREGGLPEAELQTIAKLAEAQGLQVSIQVDRLLEEHLFDQISEACFNFPEKWSIRVQDLGLAQVLYEKNRCFDLILEAGHANLNAIQAWETLLEGPLRRIVLNHEIPKRNLHPILSSLKVESETLGFGSLMMYYTPRSLLSYAKKGAKESMIQSDEMGPGSYRLAENAAGTIMYYNKDLSLLRYVTELEDAGLNVLRLDLREVTHEQYRALMQSFKERSDQALKTCWPRQLLHGFYGENKSDSIFDRLATKQIEREREPFAEVIDQTKSRLLVRTWIKGLKLPLRMSAKDGKGRWHEWEVAKVESMLDHHEKGLVDEEVFFVERPRRFPSGTLLYRG